MALEHPHLFNVIVTIAPADPFTIPCQSDDDIPKRWGWLKTWYRLFKILASFKSLRSLIYLQQISHCFFACVLCMLDVDSLHIPTAKSISHGAALNLEVDTLFVQYCPVLTEIILQYPRKVPQLIM